MTSDTLELEIKLTTADAIPVAARVLPPLVERLESWESNAAEVLTDAFCEGIRFATSEIVAALVERGINAHIFLDLKTTEDD
jgi:hypothetical protein